MSDQLFTGEQPGAEGGAPAVVAVVVTSNPGPWFEETLTALGNQDYPNLAVLIIDAGSVDDPLPRVAATLPDAYVRRLSKNAGYAAATNRAMRIVQGASHLVLCHDDVAPAPDAIRRMMEESFRTNAGIVFPKLVAWSDERILLDAGGTVDVTATYIPAIEPHDLDQGQHDEPSDVFAGAGGFVLVRFDLFSELGGLDAAMTLYGEDVDLCWRAHLAGARVRMAPDAHVRHLEAATSGLRLLPAVEGNADDDGQPTELIPDSDVLRRRHQLRTLLKVHRGPGVVLAVSRLALVNIVEILLGVVLGRPRLAGSIAAAWSWNIVHWRSLIRPRRTVRRTRIVPNRTLVRRFGSVRTRLAAAAREDWEARRELLRTEHPGRELAASLRRLPIAVWGAIVGVWVIGSRELIDGGIPTVGRFAPLPSGPVEAFQRFFGAVPVDVFGAPVPASTADLLTGIAGVVFLGAMGFLQKIAVLAMLPLGVVGALRLARPLKSKSASLAAAAAYAAVPLPYDSISLGRWEGLACYAAAPWVLARLLRAHGDDPYPGRPGALHLSLRRGGSSDDEDLGTLVVSELSMHAEPGDRSGTEAQETRLRAAATMLGRPDVGSAPPDLLPARVPVSDRLWFLVVRRVVPLALLLAVAGSIAPQILVVTAVAALALAAGDLASGGRGDGRQLAGVTAGAVAVSAVLLAPTLAGGANGWSDLFDAPHAAAIPDGFGTLLRFHGGSAAASVLTFGLLLAAVPGLVIGKGWRFRQSVRLWCVTVIAVTLSWLSTRGWLPGTLLDPRTFTAMAAAATALNAGVGVIAVQLDLGGSRSVGRRAVSALVVAALIFAAAPVAGRIAGGSWGAPGTTTTELLSWMADERDRGSFRVVWLGDADAMPGGGRRLADDLSAAVAVDSATPVGPGLPRDGGKAEDLLATALAAARAGETVQLGRLLAPLSVRYLVIPLEVGSETSESAPTPPPPGLETALGDQLDLRQIDTDASVVVYENTRWAPIRGALPPEAVLGAHSGSADAAETTDLSATTPVLGARGGAATWVGPVPSGAIYVAEDGGSGAWRYTVDGQTVTAERAFGWASTFTHGSGGNARLSYGAPIWVRVTQLFAALAWFAVAALAIHYRTRRGRYA